MPAGEYKDGETHQQHTDRVVVVEEHGGGAQTAGGIGRHNDGDDETGYAERIAPTGRFGRKLLAAEIAAQHKIGGKAEREVVV